MAYRGTGLINKQTKENESEWIQTCSIFSGGGGKKEKVKVADELPCNEVSYLPTLH